MVLDDAGPPHTLCHLLTILNLFTKRNALKSLRRKTGKMQHVLYAWNIPITPCFSCVPLMTKVAAPTCVELACAILTASISTRKPTLKQYCQIIINLCRVIMILQLLNHFLLGLLRKARSQKLLAHYVEAR